MPKPLHPRHTCAQCGGESWLIQRSLISERTVFFRRVRIYICQGCSARLYTHEEVCAPPNAPGVRLITVPARMEVHPCECGCEQYARDTYLGESNVPYHHFRYTCTRCGRAYWTAEGFRGESCTATPRSERGRRPHPYR